jgi:hypothetical protein
MSSVIYYRDKYDKCRNFILAEVSIKLFNYNNSGENMQFKINKISTLNQKMKTSKTPGLSWQNKLISTALASISLVLGAPQLALASLPVTTAANMQSGNTGTVTASTSGGVGALTITTSAQNAVINWQNFSDNTTNGGILTGADSISFVNSTLTAPGSFAVLNNIQSGIPTVLGGTITSAGKIFFLNPAGIAIGSSAVINVGAFYASTVSDLIADPYFTQYGTLSIFNGVAPSALSVSSGIIYIDSGAQITTSSYVAPTSTSAANGVVSLASGLQGAPTIKILDTAASVAIAQGSFNTTQLTINQGGSLYGSVATATDAVQVAATSLTNIGGFSVSTLGGSVNLGGTITTSNTNPTNLIGVTASGGAVNIYSQGGNFKTAGITAGGNIVINTNNTTASATQGTIVNTGTVSSTGSITLTSASTGTTGAAIYSNGANATANAYNASGIITANAGNGYLGLTGNFGGTTSSLVGAGVTLNSSISSAETVSSITSTGAVTVTTAGNITLTSITSAGAVSVSSSAGNITIPTINAQTTAGNLTVNAPTGTATLGSGSIILAGTGASTVNSQGLASVSNLTTTALSNGSISLSITTANGQPGTGITSSTTGAITLANSTINGNVLLSNNQGNTTITGPISTNNFIVYTGNGTTSLTGAITLNGVIDITSNGNSGVALNSTGNKNDYISSTGSITETNNTVTTALTGTPLPNGTTQTMGAGYNMVFTTNNGYVSLANITNPIGAAGGLFVSTNNGSSATSATTSYITITNNPALAVSGNVTLITYGNGSTITATGLNLVSSNSVGGASATTGNVLSVSALGDNANISVTGSTTDLVALVNTDAKLGSYTATGTLVPVNTGNNLTNTVTISTTGNLNVASNLVAYGITLKATNAGSSLNTGNLNSTYNQNSSVYLQSGQDIGLLDTTTAAGGPNTGTPGITHQVGNYEQFANITLISTGNVNLGSSTSLLTNNMANNIPGWNITANNGQNITLQSGTTTQNIGIGMATLTVNQLTLIGGQINTTTNITTNANGAIISGNSVTLSGANDFHLGNLAIGTVTGASGPNVGITLNSVATSATNIIGGTTSDAGFLVVTANGPINLGPTSGTALTVTGNTSVTTYGGVASNGLVLGSTPISANYGSYGTTGNATFTANGNISIGTSTNYVAVGTVNASGITYPVSIYANANGVNLGNITSNALTVATTGNITNTGGLVNASSGTLTASSTGSVTLGTTTAETSTLSVAQAGSLSITGTSGIITGNGLALSSLTLSGGAGYNQTTGSIATVNIGGSASTALNITNASVTTLNIANTASTVTTTLNNVPVGSLTINSGAGNTVTSLTNGSVLTNGSTTVKTGQTDLEVSNSTINTLTMSSTATSSTSTGGLLTYNAYNSTVTNPITFTLNYGGLNAYASGTSTLNASNVYSLGNFNIASTINGGGSFTIANLTSTTNATGSLTVSANAVATSPTTYLAGTGDLVLGSGINLSGTSGSVTFTSGNSSGAVGSVIDSAGAAPFIYGATTTIVGQKISLGGAGDPNLNMAGVAFTSNGSVSYSEQGTVSLAGLSLGTAATSASITSTAGAINQVGAGIIDTSNAVALTFTAQGTYATTGVVGSVNLSNTNKINDNALTPATASKANTGTLSIIASGNSVLNNNGTTVGDLRLGTITVMNTGNNATLAIYDIGTTTSNITQTTGSIFTWGNDIFQTNGGNITLSNAGNNFGAITALATSSGNVNIAETATSTYNMVTSKLWTATSASGDIITATNNTSLSTVGATLSATTGNINLTGFSGGTNYGNGAITVTAPLGNVTLLDVNTLGTVIGSGSKVGGNLSVTNNTSTGSLAIQDVTTGSGISVTGIASFTALNGSIFLANSSDAFGGLYGYTNFSKSFTASVTGPLVIQPGSQSGTASLTATGNISNAGLVAADTFTTLTLVSTAGTSVTLTDPLKVTAGLTVYAPGANVNLAGLSKSIDLNGVSPLITSSSNTAPTP